MKTKNIFRTFLMAAFLLAGANSVKAEDIVLWEGTTNTGYTQCKTTYEKQSLAESGMKMRIYTTIQDHNNWGIIVQSGWSNSFEFSDWKGDSDGKNLRESHLSTAYTVEGNGGYFEMTLSDKSSEIFKAQGMDIHMWGVVTTSIILTTGETAGPHDITIADNITNGTLSADKTSAEKDEEVTLTAVSTVGYKLKNFIVNGKTTVATVTSTQVNEDGTITTIGTFAMLGKDVTVSAEFIDKNIIWEGSSGEVTIDKSFFNDIAPNCTLRVWADKKVFEIKAVEGTVLFNTQYQNVITNDDLDTYYKENSYFEFILSEDHLTAIKKAGLYLRSDWGNSKITKVMLIPSSSSTPSTKTDVTLSYSALTASATTASIGQTLTNAPTLTSSVEGLTFTYESSNTTVAEVNSEGVVTIKGAGTTIIKAIFAGDDTYNKAEANYTLTVTETTYAITISESENGQISVSATEAAANTLVTITATPNDGYKLSAISVKTEDNNIDVSGTGNTRTFTMPAQDVTISATFTVIPTIEAEITSSTGFATFCCNQALDFTDITTLEAYYAKTVEDGNVYLLRVYGTVKAGTGLLIKGATTRIPVVESGDNLVGNLLVGVGTDTEVKSTTDYVLTEKNGAAVFAQTGVNAATVKAGHAYLSVSNAQARTRTIGIGGEGTTGIENRFVDDNEQSEEVIYNLNGQRVKNPRKGLYIINGKKVLVK